MTDNIKKNGVVFTPKYICDFMVEFIQKKNNLRIFEPSCGHGAFFNSIFEYGLHKNNIIEANDINIEFINKCKEQYPCITYYNYNFIDYSKKKYNVIIGNPPYVRIQNLKKDEIIKIKNEYPIISGNLDLYIYFIIKCTDMLDDDGKLIFIVPNSFLYNKSCIKIKNFLIDNGYLEYVIDFKDKKIFTGFSTYTCIIVINKYNSKNRNFYYYKNNIEDDYIKIKYYKETIRNSLLNYINVKNGIATLSDNIFIIDKVKNEDEKFIYFEKNNKKYKIETSIVKKVLKVSKNKIDYIITPYENGKIIDNLELYPECNKYLLEYKEKLLQRDKGKKKYEKWYAYGRKQGIQIIDNDRLFISCLVKNIKDYLIQKNVSLFYSGLWIELKENSNLTYEKLIEILQKNEQKILEKSNVKSQGWFSINKSSFDIEICL